MFSRFRRTAATAPTVSVKKRFEYVSSLVDGSLSPLSKHPSLLFFTAHKCASAYVGNMLWHIAASQSIFSIDLDGFAINQAHRTDVDRQALRFSSYGRKDDAELSLDEQRAFQSFFKTRGFFYGPFRHPVLAERLTDLDHFKILLLLRDPRDVLTSWYYSIAFSHVPPGNPDRLPEFEKKRNDALHMSIDDFVLKHVQGWGSRFRRTCQVLLPLPNVCLVKYEDMVENFDNWLDQVLSWWELRLDQNTRQTILRDADFQVDREDVHAHKRQVTPGDHRRKLKPQTIQRLDDELGDVLDILGYPRNRRMPRAA